MAQKKHLSMKLNCNSLSLYYVQACIAEINISIYIYLDMNSGMGIEISSSHAATRGEPLCCIIANDTSTTQNTDIKIQDSTWVEVINVHTCISRTQSTVSILKSHSAFSEALSGRHILFTCY